MAQARGIRIHQYLDDWLLRAPCPETCLQHTQTLLALCQQLGWVVNMKKSQFTPQQVFNFVGYWFDLVTGQVLPTQDRWTTLQEKFKFIKHRKSCTVRQFISLIGLLTATEKQVWSGRLHMRPIQWHLKRHWHVPEVLEKVIPVPQSLHPHLDWWLDEDHVLRGQPLHPLQHALQLFTDASNEGWGAHLGDSTARGVWSVSESRLHINFLELKAVFLALKSFEHLCRDQIVLIATDNTTRHEIRLSLCPPLETSVVVSPKRNNSQGSTHSGAVECDSRQTIQTQPADLDRVVPLSARVQSLVFEMGPATGRPICNPVQQQTSQVCVASTGSDCLGSGRTESVMGKPGCLCLFSHARMHSAPAGRLYSHLANEQDTTVMLLERGIRDISRVLVLARNSVYSARSVEDAIPHVYKRKRLYTRRRVHNGRYCSYIHAGVHIRVVYSLYTCHWRVYKRVENIICITY